MTSTTEEVTTGEANTQPGSTEQPQPLDQDVVITLSVLIPAVFLSLFGGTTTYCYLQYRRNGGWKWGCLPCGKKSKKLKDSNESVNSQDPCAVAAAGPTSKGPGVATLANKVEDLGCSSMDSLDNMEETELYTASPSGASILPIPEPIPEPIPKGKQPNTTQHDMARSRPYHPRAVKKRGMFDFDPEQTAEHARKQKNK